MRSKNVILFFALLAVSAYSFDLSAFVELGEIKNDPIGKSLIETIQMSLEKTQGGRIENITSLLDDLLSKLILDQKRDDVAWGKEKARLDKLINDLTLEISRLQAEISSLRKERAGLKAKVTTAISNIAQFEAQRVANTKSLNDLTVKRKQDKANFKASVRDHAAVIGAIEQVIANLEKLRGSVAGIGKPAHVRSTAQEKRDKKWKDKMKKSFVQIVGDDVEASAFAELATEADQSALDKLINLLNRIMANVKKSLGDDEKYEKESRAIYKRLKVTLTKDNEVLDTSLTKQRANKANYEKRITDLSVTIKIRKGLLVTRGREKGIQIQSRFMKENAYNRTKKERDQQEKVIRKLQRIVKDRLARMSQFLKSKVN